MAYFVTPLRCFPAVPSGDVGPGTRYPFAFASFAEAVKFAYALQKISEDDGAGDGLLFNATMDFTFTPSGFPSFPITGEINTGLIVPEGISDLPDEVSNACERGYITSTVLESDGDSDTAVDGMYTLNYSSTISVSMAYRLYLDDIVTSGGNFYPRFHFDIDIVASGVGNVMIGDIFYDANFVTVTHLYRSCLSDFGDFPGTPALNGTVSFLGKSVDVYLATYDDTSQLSGSTYTYTEIENNLLDFSVTPSGWWPYDPGDGNGPVWDATTGAQLRAPVVRDGNGEWHEV